MIQKKTAGWTRVVAFLLAAAILGGTGAAAFAAEDEAAEKDICRRALDRCYLDAVKSGGLGNIFNLVIQVSSCLAGYDFCRRYIVILAEELAR